MPKKRQRESPFKPELMAAMSRELPGILAKEGYFKKTNEIPQPEAPIQEPPAIRPIKRNQLPLATVEFISPPNHAHIPEPIPRGNLRALWYAVVAVGVLIVGIWAFNLRTVVGSVWAERDGATIVNQGKNDLQSILETIKQNDKIAQERLREANQPVTPVSPPTTSPQLNSVLNNLAEAIKAEQNN